MGFFDFLKKKKSSDKQKIEDIVLLNTTLSESLQAQYENYHD